MDNCVYTEFVELENILFEKWKMDNSRDLALLDYHYLRGRPAYNKKGGVDKSKSAKLRRESAKLRNQLLGKNLTKKPKTTKITKEQYQGIEEYFNTLKKSGKLQGIK